MTIARQTQFLEKRKKKPKMKIIITKKRFLRGTRRLLRRKKPFRYRRKYPRNDYIGFLLFIVNIPLLILFGIVSLLFGGASNVPIFVYILFFVFAFLISAFILGDKSKPLKPQY